MPPVGAFLAGAASFLTTGVVAGAGITGAWAAGAATASFLTTTVVGRLLTTVALSALSRAMAPKPRTPGLVTETTTTGEAASQASLLGFYATAGHHLCPPMTHGTHGKTQNAYLTYVVALSDLPGCTLQRLLVNDQPVTLATTPDANGFFGATGRFANFLWVKVYDGTQTVADPWLLSKYGTGTKQDISVGRPWLGDMVGPGLCYAIVTFRYDRPRFSGLPKLLFEMMGVPLYDPRKDGTVGGSGAHRWSDPATWEPSANPIVQVYSILRGIQLPGAGVGGSGIWGLGVPAADLPLSNWFAAMNVCDQPVDGAPQYRAGYEIRFDDEPGAVIEELLKTCSGALSEMGGVWKVRAGAAGLPVHYFTDEDLVLGDSTSFTPFGSLNETHNGVTASYPDPEALWQPKEAPPRYNAAWAAEDFNRQLVAALDLPACPYPVQVQRLMRAWIEDERRFRRHTLALPPDAAILEPLDVVSWTSAENGYVEKTFEVVEIGDDPGTMIQHLALREVNAADYDWMPADQIPWDTSPVGPDVPSDLAPDAFTVIGLEIRDGQNIGRRPALRLEWSEEDFELIAAVEWEVRRSGTTEVIATGTMNNPAARAVVVSAGLIGATSYDARIRYIAPGLTTLWTGWVTASTPDVRLTAEDISTAVIQEIAEAQAAADQAVADALAADAKAQAVRADHDALVAGFTGTLAAAFSAIEGDLTSITADLSAAYDSTTGQIRAAALSGYYTAAATDGAISAAIDSFEAEFRDTGTGQIKATALTNYYTKADSDQAIAAESTVLQARIDTLDQSVQGWQVVTDEVSDINPGADTTVTQGAAALGQSGTIIVSQVSTGGGQNGAWLMVPVERAILFVGQRIKIGVLARKPAANASTRFNVIYATNDHSSNFMESNPDLTSDWQWFTFHHDVPQAIAGGPGYLFIYGDAARAGNGVEIARVYIEIAAVAGELPEIDTLTATVTTQGTAITDLQNGASAGYLIKAQAGGAVSLIDLIAADGGGGTPTSVVRISADDILLDGSVSARKLVVHDNSAVFSEVFDSTAALADWQNYAGSGELAIVSSAHARQGGKVLQVGNNSGDDQAWYVARTLIPVDPDRTYRIRAGLRKNAGAGMIYLGFVGVAADGVTLVNNTGANTHTAQFYAPSGGQSPALNTYTDITGYVRGVGSGGAGTLASPRLIHANVRYLRPVIIVNYENVAGQTLVDYVKVDTVSDATLIADGAISTEKIVAGAITAASGIIADAAIANAKIANGAITTAKIGDLQVNTIKIANNAITSLVATEISSGSPTFSFTATVGTSAVVFATFQVAIYTWFNSENSNGEYYSYNVALNGKSIGGGYTSVNNTNLSPFWESFAIPVQITQASNTISVSGAIVSSSSKVGLGALKVLK